MPNDDILKETLELQGRMNEESAKLIELYMHLAEKMADLENTMDERWKKTLKVQL